MLVVFSPQQRSARGRDQQQRPSLCVRVVLLCLFHLGFRCFVLCPSCLSCLAQRATARGHATVIIRGVARKNAKPLLRPLCGCGGSLPSFAVEQAGSTSQQGRNSMSMGDSPYFQDPALRVLWQAVTSDPMDFQSWTALLSQVQNIQYYLCPKSKSAKGLVAVVLCAVVQFAV